MILVAAGKESAYKEGDLGAIPGLGRSPRERKGYPLRYSGLENSMDCIVRGVAKSRTRLSDFHIHFSGSRVEGRLGSGRWEVITLLGGDAVISAGGGMGLKGSASQRRALI